MKRVAIVNANSFGRYFPNYIDMLSERVGPVERFTFDQDISAEDLSDALKDYTYVISGTVPQFSEKFFELNTSIEYIARFGVGYNNINVVAANKHGVLVSNIPSHLEKEDVAEQAVALLLGVTKHIVGGNEAARADQWNYKRERFMGQRINRKTVGVIGLGHIGSTFARIMKHGYECDVIAYDPYLDDAEFAKRHAKSVSLETLLKTSDIISLHSNLTKENYHLIDETAISQMKKTVLIVNSARGDLVDEHAIAAALDADRIAGYGADVIENEPPLPTNPLLASKNTVLTPHLGTYNWECNDEMCASVVEDIINVNSGREPVSRLEK